MSNGLQAIVQRDSSTPWVAVVMRYRVGFRDETSATRGLAHLAEHLSYGRSRHLALNEALTLLQTRGGAGNGKVDEDETVYFSVVPATELALPLFIESERMAFVQPMLNDDALQAEVAIIRRELAMRVGFSTTYMGEIMRTAYPAGHPYHVSVDNQRTSNRYGLDDAKRFLARYYRPDNATLTVVGDLQPERAWTLIERYFGDIRAPGRMRASAVEVPPVYKGRASMTISTSSADRPAIDMIWPIRCTKGPCLTELHLLSVALENEDASPLYRSLMIERDLAASISVRWTARERHQELWLRIQLRPGAALDEVQTLVDEGLQQMAKSQLEQREFKALQTDAQTRWLLALEAPLSRALSLLTVRTVNDSELPDQPALFKRLQELKAEDLRAAAQRFVPVHRCLLVHVRPVRRGYHVERRGSLQLEERR